MALVAVMWLVAALSILVMSLVATTKADVRSTHSMRAFIEHEARGDAAIRVAAAQLLVTPLTDGPRVVEVLFDDQVITVDVVPAAAFVNINTASIELLRDTLRYGAGLAEADAQVLAERIVDWRDPDDAALPNGAERDAYVAAGSVFRPRNGPFETVDDLIQVLGMELDIHDKISGLLTTYGGAAGVDPTYASPEVLMVLAAGGEGAVDAILAARDAGRPAPLVSGLNQQYVGASSSGPYRFRARQQHGDVVLSRVRWIELAGGGDGMPWREIGAEAVRSEQVVN